MRPLALLSVLLALPISGCTCWPCGPDGVVQALVIVEDGNIITSAPYHYGEWGTVDESELETCTAVAGGIHFLGRVPSFQAFDAIRYVGGNVMFDGVVDLDDVDGFPVLGEIGGSLWVTQDTDRIEEVSGFPVLHTVDELNFRGPVAQVTGLGALDEVYGGATFNPAPLDVAGFLSLRAARNFHFWGGALTENSFPGLEVVHRDLHVFNSNGTAVGFPRLREVERDLHISSNPRLGNVATMADLDRVGRHLTVVNNDMLSSEGAREWASAVQVGDRVSICANLGGEEEDPCPPDVP